MTSAPRRWRGRRRGEACPRRPHPRPLSLANGRRRRWPRPHGAYERRGPGKSAQSSRSGQAATLAPRQDPRTPPPGTPPPAPGVTHDMSHGQRADMVPEIAAAVGFLSSLLRTRGCVSEQRLKVFSTALQEALTEHYKHHWFPEKPSKGSGYRCIRINHKMDPIISKVASQIGLSPPQLHQLLPSELTLWVDPYEVSYRIGEDGSICVLYEEAPVPASCGLLTCKNQMLLGRTSPSKSYVMAVSS